MLSSKSEHESDDESDTRMSLGGPSLESSLEESSLGEVISHATNGGGPSLLLSISVSDDDALTSTSAGGNSESESESVYSRSGMDGTSDGVGSRSSSK